MNKVFRDNSKKWQRNRDRFEDDEFKVKKQGKEYRREARRQSKFERFEQSFAH